MDNKNFMAKIMASLSNFERNIRKAQRLAKTAVPDEINTDVDANISKFQRALQKAKALAQKWREHKVDIDGNSNPLTRAIAKAKASLATLRKHTVKIDVDTSATSKMQRAFRAIETQINDFQNKVDRFASDIRSFGTVFSQTFKGVMLTSVQGLIPVIAGLVPVLFSVLNAAKAASGGVVALAGAGAIGFAGFAAYAGMAVTAIKMLNDGTIKATKQTKAYESALEGVKTQWQDIVKSNANKIFQSMANGLNAMKSALKSLTPFFAGVAKGVEKASASLLKWTQTSAVAKKFFNMLNTTGVSVFNKLLSAAGRFGDGLVNVFTQLAPLFQWSANWLDRLGKSFSNWANSAAGQNSIKQFMEYTKTNLPIIGNIFKNVFAGIANLMKAFGQNSTNIFKYLEQMSAKFREWSETVGNSQGFKKFVDYMQQNGPVIMQLIGNIVKALVAFGTAMAPIASAILNVVTKIVGFTAALMENHPWIARVVGVAAMLLGAIWALAVPLMAVNSFLGLFGSSLAGLVGKFIQAIAGGKVFQSFLGILGKAFELVKSPIGLITRMLPMLGEAMTALAGPVGIVIAVIAAFVAGVIYLWNTNEAFRTAMTNIWTGLTSTIGTAIQGIITWFTNLWNTISQTLAPIMPLLIQFGTIIMQALGVTAMQAITMLSIAFQTLWTVVSVVFQTIGMIISVAVQLIVGLFTALVQFLSGDFSGAWQTLSSTVQIVMGTIWGYLQSVWGTIQGYLQGVWGSIKSYFSVMWDNMSSKTQNTVQNIWSSISGGFSRILSSIISNVSQWLANVRNGFNTMISSAVSGMAGFIGQIVSGFVNVVSEIGSGVSRGVAKVGEFFGDMVAAGGDLIRGLADGIANGASAVISAAANVAKKAISAAKSVLGIHSPSRVFRGIGGYMMQGMTNGIGGGQGSAINAATKAANSVTDAFKSNLSSDLTDGVGSNLGGNVDSHLTKDVRHSMTENSRPIVKVNVHNESDLPAIKSWIDDVNSRENALTI